MDRPLWKYGGTLLMLIALAACGQSPAQTTQPQPDASQAPVAISGGTASTTGQGGPIVSHGGALTGHVGFIDNLRANGLMVEPVGSVEQPFLAVKGETLRISGGELKQPAEVQSFEYASADAAETDLSQIGPDGNPTTAMVAWKAPPHFFQKEQLVVLYVGDDQAVLKILADLLGPQIAGK